VRFFHFLCVEGPYEYEKVKLGNDDIVIDAGANLGLFSLYCLNKNVQKVYAFEPQKSVLPILEKNILLNNAEEYIEIVPFGLSDKVGEFELSHSNIGPSAASIVIDEIVSMNSEVIKCVDLDSWVIENNIFRVDFIKADIEGAERKMLAGATRILKDFSPNLAICTYHFPDDLKYYLK